MSTANATFIGRLRQEMIDAHPDRGGSDAAFIVARRRYEAATVGAKLAEDIRDTYQNYVAFHSDYAEEEAGTLTLWTFHTYAFAVADTTPYILVTAPTSAAGKSRIFDVAKCLVHSPFTVVDPTPAALFHAIEILQPTLLVDEADMLRENRALRAVLNAGFQPGAPIIRAKQAYGVFCPKAFAGIEHEKPPLREATLSRCIRIPMRRRRPDEPIASFHRLQVFNETELTRKSLTEWAREYEDDLAYADPGMPPGMTDRQEDMWTPLFAIADLIGWGEESRNWAVSLSKAVKSDPDPGVQILADCHRVLNEWTGNRIPSSTLASLRNALPGREYDDDLSTMQLSKRLQGFGIHPESSPFRMGGKGSPTQRGFIVRRGAKFTPEWADAFERYGIEPVTESLVTPVAEILHSIHRAPQRSTGAT